MKPTRLTGRLCVQISKSFSLPALRNCRTLKTIKSRREKAIYSCTIVGMLWLEITKVERCTRTLMLLSQWSQVHGLIFPRNEQFVSYSRWTPDWKLLFSFWWPTKLLHLGFENRHLLIPIQISWLPFSFELSHALSLSRSSGIISYLWLAYRVSCCCISWIGGCFFCVLDLIE